MNKGWPESVLPTRAGHETGLGFAYRDFGEPALYHGGVAGRASGLGQDWSEYPGFLIPPEAK